MNKMKKILFSIAALAALTAQAQVKFNLTLLDDKKTYQVSIVPEKTWDAPFNITGTGQITLVTNTGTFEVKNFENINPNIEWHFNSRTNNPQENDGFDYHSVGLKSLGTSLLTYKSGIEIPLFTFENALPCTGSISLLDHSKDQFFKNPNKKANIGNYISVYGAEGDAYKGNIGKGEAPCALALNSTNLELNESFTLSPNPFISDLNVKGEFEKLNNASKIRITNELGTTVFEKELENQNSIKSLELNLEFLTNGIYSVSIIKNGKVAFSEKVVKMD
jgi:hypothetical protein